MSPSYVPADNEKVQLVFRGSHSKGCYFLHHEIEPSVLVNFMQVMDQFEGLHFARIDTRFSSLEDLQKGKFSIIEINGIGAESTNIYDPKNSFADMRRILREQWHVVLEFGTLNLKRDKGLGQDGFFSFLKEFIAFKKQY